MLLPASISTSAFAMKFAAAGAVIAVVGLLGLWLLPTCPHCGLRCFRMRSHLRMFRVGCVGC